MAAKLPICSVMDRASEIIGEVSAGPHFGVMTEMDEYSPMPLKCSLDLLQCHLVGIGPAGVMRQRGATENS